MRIYYNGRDAVKTQKQRLFPHLACSKQLTQYYNSCMCYKH